MATQIIEASSKEIVSLMQTEAFAGQKWRITVEPLEDEEDLATGIPAPPFAVRENVHLEQLVLEAIHAPKELVTDQEWVNMRQEVRDRLACRNG